MIEKIKKRVPPKQLGFEIRLYFSGPTVASSSYTDKTPKELQNYLNDNLFEIRDDDGSSVIKYTAPFTDMVETIIDMSHSRGFKVVSQTRVHKWLIIAAIDRYDEPIYSVLRRKLYPRN